MEMRIKTKVYIFDFLLGIFATAPSTVWFSGTLVWRCFDFAGVAIDCSPLHKQVSESSA